MYCKFADRFFDAVGVPDESAVIRRQSDDLVQTNCCVMGQIAVCNVRICCE